MKLNSSREIKTFLKWYLGTLLLLCILTVVLLCFNGFSFRQSFGMLPEILKNNLPQTGLWLFLLLPYLLFLLFRFLVRSFKKGGRQLFITRFTVAVLMPLAFIFSAFKFSQWYTKNENSTFQWDYSIENVADTVLNYFSNDKKFRGVHFFGGRRFDGKEIFLPLVKNHVEWIVHVPYGWQQDYNSNSVGMSSLGETGWSRLDSSIARKDSLARTLGIQSIMKPHIWIGTPSAGKWRSDIAHDTDQEWEKWAADYKKFILHYAKISEALGIKLFCIGTELHSVVKNKPEFWFALIRDVRKIYRGKLTYGANWHNEFEDVPFWNKLDYIGIQAYFPLTEKPNPAVRDLVKGWEKHLLAIEAVQATYNKPILFTEIGYKSTEDAAKEPWQWADAFSGLYKKVSTQTQANCYEAFFQVFWHKEWFAGALVWDWRANHKKAGGVDNINFTPQNKAAENVLAKWFGINQSAVCSRKTDKE